MDPPASLVTNWAGNIFYGAAQTATPATVDEVCQVVVASTRAKAVGSGHSFRAIASTSGTLISMREFARIDSLGADGSVRVGAGVTYGELGRHLALNGRALANFASLPHISRRGDPDFDGAVVSLACLGVVAAVTLETVAAFELRQYVFEAIPWRRTERELPRSCGPATARACSSRGHARTSSKCG
jgi:xylitol oxidase